MLEAYLEVTGMRVVIDLGHLATDSEAFFERVQDVLPILVALVSADGAWQGLTHEDRHRRAPASMAMEMKSQAALLAAKVQAELQVAIIEGRQFIADHGFPEFQDGRSLDD